MSDRRRVPPHESELNPRRARGAAVPGPRPPEPSDDWAPAREPNGAMHEGERFLADYPRSDHGIREDRGGLPYTNGEPHGVNLAPHEEASIRYSYPAEDDHNQGDYMGRSGSVPPAGRFLDDAASDYDDQGPDEDPAPRSRARIFGFYLLMVLIGSSSGALWFYYGPNLSSASGASSSSTAPVDKTTEALNRLVDGQNKLVQSVAAIQAAQDALQKSMASREQELQRLSAETAALRNEVNGLRTGLGELALRLHAGQGAKNAPPPMASKKSKTEHGPSTHQPPQPEPKPMAVSPPSQ